MLGCTRKKSVCFIRKHEQMAALSAATKLIRIINSMYAVFFFLQSRKLTVEVYYSMIQQNAKIR